MNENKDQKEFKEGRFEFALYVNDNLICKRNFHIGNYIEESMHTLDFKNKVDEICSMIDEDLKSKSRVYTWYYFDENYTDDELHQPLLEEWECTFKFVVCDNDVPVITKIWDGRGYPKQIRERVDIANKFVKIINQDGKVTSYEKNAFFEERGNRLSAELYVLKSMIMDKDDLLLTIIKEICATCSPRDSHYQNIKDYQSVGKYKDTASNTQKKYPCTPHARENALMDILNGKGKKSGVTNKQ